MLCLITEFSYIQKSGSAREAHLQQEIQEGQKLRLRSVQDDLLMCLRKQEDIDQTINKLNEVSIGYWNGPPGLTTHCRLYGSDHIV